MHRALTAEQSRAVEARAIAETGVTIETLMRAAGTVLAGEVFVRAPEGEVVVVAGPGNNGGDGWVCALELAAAGRDVRVVALRAPDALAGAARDAAALASASGVRWTIADVSTAGEELAAAACVVDAILGTGATLPLSDDVAAWCEAVNGCGALVISADQPTGLDTDTGVSDPHAVWADCTVAFTAPTRCLVVHPGAGHAGEIAVADIGVEHSLADVEGAPELWTPAEYAALLPVPMPDAHKNSRGRLLIISGSTLYPGAAVLAARGAMRAGAGYVMVAVPEPVLAVVQAHLVASPVIGLPASGGRTFSSVAASAVLDIAAEYDAVLLGPGLTVADGAVAMARTVAAQLNKPLVIDADGLNAFVDATHLLASRGAPTVLTPHPGELARLIGVRAGDVQSARIDSSARLAGPSRAVVLKGAGTVTSVSGRQVINTSGTPALATAGTGDVLAGVVGAFVAQGLAPFEAGALGAYLHGRAGEAAAADLTPMCVTAEDVPEYLPVAMAELLESW